MKEVESILEPIKGHLSSIKRDTINGWYELEIGIPTKWVFNQNDEVGIELISENDLGKLLRISPKNENVSIDDLIIFVEIIINTNIKIAEKEKQFADKMEETKEFLEKQAVQFYKELDELRNTSFSKLNDKFINELRNNEVKESKKGKKIPIISG